ncbi:MULTISPECIES: HlyD family secretion protein [Brevibacillus]|jgi:multidrug resistance efflux pump|uniref:HlyD family secretion protein n=2 Tax=Brevibacillus TaxID=55080 RepID=A0A1I3L7A4_9BACL|nr:MULTISPECIES: HlyD family efflux transporter periplasmic adaptor subunit [Brevibacillus]MEC2130146.1 HlyD family efflux transporter periplasmic adaptor subunit [Brevibacillus centrosporus]MED1793294.1 HlyD family efflux transporter periplasmic adaptor subunit [Brevibacillus nitrificans]MED1951029.1 HlyD family efflux transporter periplasmic adaptor subunit [Brevibacillus centrosporus]MED4907050.1 HlyD family efflux transporter periplasmic adaptor subunit [Brevibacillus centrosporus]RNB66233
MKRKLVLYVILLLIVVGGGGIGYYYWYQGAHYVTTQDARITGDIYRVMPKMTGKLTGLAVKEGDTVVADQIVGQQDTTNIATNLLENSVLRAPITGTVIKTQAKEGEVVSTGTSVALVIDENKLYISANLEETEIARLKLGQKVDFTVDAYPGKQLSGHLMEIGKATNSTFSLLPATNTSGNFTKVTQRIPIKIAIDDTAGLHLAAGLNVEIKVHVKEM